MGLRTNPTQRQRRLGIELRRLRLAAGMSVGAAAAAADLGPAHLGHIEAARTAIPEVKLRALAAAYGCRSEPLIDALVAMAQASGKGWWSEYKTLLPAQALDLAELEYSAIGCRSFQWLYMPGLLQSPAYMEALFRGGEPDADPATRARYVEFRLRRQQALQEGTLQFHTVIHETALRMQFVPAEVMRGQIEHLVNMARLPNVRVQVLPLRSGVYPVQFSTPFVIYEATATELNTVYVEQPISSPFVSDQEHLRNFSTAFDSLSAVALEPIDAPIEPEFHARRDSFALVQHLLYEL
ncbi:transcriptional regulator [Streptomyces mashuensis]|uniref:Transcriptional regulator n=1 Tax=Streptomyces mashuensis TaxID=33904 RepID=A0A919B4D0_9ACTN|nr:DUF5753 domain-containing protein [Streptomyces mashuensis]GHF46937.1 transcriptional regulator [Streptomyces mashuensis]